MFSDIPINYFSCTHRSIDPLKTIANYEHKLKIAGITRITEITHLDRVGIPVFSAIRPTAQDGGVSIYAGKGATRNQAKASAMMEGFERYSAEKQPIDDKNSIIATVNELENSIHPESLILPNETKNLDFDSKKIQWTTAIDITDKEEYYVPSNAIFHPYVPTDSVAIFKGNSNGLASGNVLEESVLHGMLEVIERDAWSIFELSKKNKKQIEIASIKNPIINSILEKFREESIEIKLLDLTADVKIPTMLASADDTRLKDPALLTIGVGTHLNPEIAIMRALTEVAQSRATQIHGTREDTSRAVFMRKAGYERMKKINKEYFIEEEDKINLTDIEDNSTNSLKHDIEITVNELRNNSFDKILFTNLTREEIGVNVIRMIIPGTETYTVDSERIGNRWMKF
ncbi:YcaO-like family protein [Methanobrevibacter cuticularis]|uniref:YcaO-like family protein n=1 Tax=Methanobrevibacter cuticularis TaxID=47311 RepID=A0A166E496_9EURY|nr:YcaO-related McrA-glycine thioamidation protein [Methanobrevibacter cuticularis]KZX16263.1 YcaO-like family protein [Methanobrevibacter cuticularis]